MAGRFDWLTLTFGELQVSILFCLENGWKYAKRDLRGPDGFVSILFCLENGWKLEALWDRYHIAVSILFCLENGWKVKCRWNPAFDCWKVSILFCLENGWKNNLGTYITNYDNSFNPLLSGEWLEV